MSKIIIERVENCTLVKSESVYNGHDCWGNSEFSEEKYVFINSTRENVWDGWYVMHDGKNVIKTGPIYLLPNEIRPFIENKSDIREGKIEKLNFS